MRHFRSTLTRQLPLGLLLYVKVTQWLSSKDASVTLAKLASKQPPAARGYMLASARLSAVS